MTPVTTKQWTDALRSGDYEQGTGGLCIDNKYCCLGVLATIAGATQKRNIIHSDWDDFIFSSPGISTVRENTYIPYDYQSTILTDLDLTVAGPFCRSPLPLGFGEIPIGNIMSLMNDEDGASFSEIADKIDEFWAAQNKDPA